MKSEKTTLLSEILHLILARDAFPSRSADTCHKLLTFSVLALGFMTAAAPVPAQDVFSHCWDREGAARSRCIYRSARDHQKWQEGVHHLRTWLQAEPKSAHANDTLGSLLFSMGDTELAIEHFTRAAESYAESGKASYETTARLNLSECLRLGSRLIEAEVHSERAIQAAEASGNVDLVGEARLMKFRLASQRGEDLETTRQGLRDFAQEWITVDKPIVSYRVLKSWSFDMSSVLVRLRRMEEALVVYRRWREAAQEQGNTYDEATALVAIATSLSEIPWRIEAAGQVRQVAREGLELAESAGQVFAEADALRLLGRLTPDEEGRAFLRRCLERTQEGASLRMLCLTSLASSFAADSDSEAARQMLDQVSIEIANSNDPWSAAYGWSDRFQVQWLTRSRDLALEDSLRLLDIIESLRSLQSSGLGRADFFGGWIEVYQALIGRLLEAPGEPSRAELEQAFLISERMRARVLLDRFLETDSALSTDPAVAEERSEARERIVNLQKRLQSPALKGPDREALLSELEETEQQLQVFESQSTAHHTRTTDSSQAPHLAGLGELEQALEPHQAFFVFQLAPDRDIFGKPAGGSWLWAITRDQQRIYRLPSGPEVTAKVSMLLGLVEGESTPPALLQEVATVLRKQLLQEAIDELPPNVDHWILAPEGLLNLLPFSLMMPEATLSVVPSATLWLRWRRPVEESQASALAFADPEIGSTHTDGERLGVLEHGLQLGRLPHARREGRNLVRQLGSSSRLLTGSDASESNLIEDSLDDFRILHFAAHAVLDERRPYRSAILLAPGEAEDGLLQPREIVELDLNGKLVVLSTCQSASGRARLGEGVDSLARAFFLAGARTVIASLWQLRDEEAAAFFDLFYTHIADGKSVSQAVAEARQRRRLEGAPASSWASVVVLGDGDWVPSPSGASSSRASILAAVAVAFGLLGCLGLLGGTRKKEQRRHNG